MTLGEETSQVIDGFVALKDPQARAKILALARAVNAPWPTPRRHFPDVVVVEQEIGARVRARRQALGLSQADLGSRVGMTHSQIQKLEKAETRIGAGQVQRIATVLGVTPNHLFGVPEWALPVVETPSNEVSNNEVRAMTDAFLSIEDKEKRWRLLGLIREVRNQG
jgi:transcriptional regulator with XRE-family HTH domain